MLWCLLRFLASFFDESDITVLALLPRDHRSLRNYVGDDDIKAGRILLVTLPPGLPGMPAHPTVTRLVNLNPRQNHTVRRGKPVMDLFT